MVFNHDIEVLKGVKIWELRMISNDDIDALEHELYLSDNCLYRHERLIIEDVYESSSNSGPKIQLPYNWLVTEEEENENMEAKTKEYNLANIGLSIGQRQ